MSRETEGTIDPMQSIYRFRNADVGLLLRASFEKWQQPGHDCEEVFERAPRV